MLKISKDILHFGKSKPILGFDDTTFFRSTYLINVGIMMGVLYMDLFFSGPYDRLMIFWIAIFLSIFVQFYVMRIFYLLLVKRFPGYDNRKKRMLRLPLILPISIMLTFLFNLFVDPFFHISADGCPEALQNKELATMTIMVIIDVFVYEAFHLFAEFGNTKIKQTKLEKEHLSSQLAGLRNQISPHFLFNCFNTLIYLIDEDKEKGKEFIYKLSFIYSSILESSRKDLVSLENELKFISAYIDLLRERFGSNLNVAVNMDGMDGKKQIIPLALQVGVENAVKHNTISKKSPLSINIHQEEDYIVITNTLQPKSAKSTSHGLGLKNLIDRYSIITDKNVIVTKKEQSFILKLPLLR